LNYCALVAISLVHLLGYHMIVTEWVVWIAQLEVENNFIFSA